MFTGTIKGIHKNTKHLLRWALEDSVSFTVPQSMNWKVRRTTWYAVLQGQAERYRFCDADGNTSMSLKLIGR